VSFSPNKSFLTKSLFHENEGLLNSQPPLQEDKAPSPIKLIENFKTKDQIQDKSDTKPPKKAKVRPPRAKQDAIKGFLKAPTQIENATSSEDEEDDLALAQRWLNHRKQRINEINQQIQEEQLAKQQKEDSDDESEPVPRQYRSNNTSASLKRQIEDKFSPNNNVSPINRGQSVPSQKAVTAFTTEPTPTNKSPVRFSHKTLYNSAGKMGGAQSQSLSPPRNEAKKLSNSASKANTIAFDLNNMTPEEMIELKKILDERLQIEQLKKTANNMAHSAEKKLQRIEEILNSPENQKFAAKKDTSPITNRSPGVFGTLLEDTNRQNPFFNASKPFEPLDTLVKTLDTKKDSKNTLVDSSIMKDFESIRSEYSTPHPNKFKAQGLTTQKLEDLSTKRGQVMESLDFEKLYDEKLKEFLRIRDRMLQANLLKDTKDINVEEILRTTLRGDLLRYQHIEDTARITDGTSKMPSPPSIRSLGKDDPPILSERDLLLTDQSRRRTGLTSNLMTEQSKDIKRSPILKPSPPILRKKSPKERQITFSTEPTIRTITRTQEDDDEEDALAGITDDFYDDMLFDLLDDIEKKDDTVRESKASKSKLQSTGPNIAPVKISTNNSQKERIRDVSPPTKQVPSIKPLQIPKKELDDEFQDLLTSVI